MSNLVKGYKNRTRTETLPPYSSDQDEEVPSLGYDETRWRGLMGGQYMEISLAAASLIVPMLALALTLLGLVYTHRMPDHQSIYSTGQESNSALGADYYINYSATRLVFLSSLSSTLSTILFASAMVLFSFPLAYGLANKSDLNHTAILPSPYQLELLTRTIDGRLTVLWAWLCYVCASKNQRIKIVPDLRNAVVMLLSLVLLTTLLTLSDTWLHIGTESVRYLELLPEMGNSDFAPGKSLPDACLNETYPARQAKDPGLDCLYAASGSGGGGNLLYCAEYVKTAANISETSRVYTIDDLTILGPAITAQDLDFQASSFGSRTSCQMVTKQCGPHRSNPGGAEAAEDVVYKCNATGAGLKLTGNFSVLTTSTTSAGLVDDQNSNGFLLTDYQFGTQYYQDASRLNKSNGPPAPYNESTLYWAMVFQLGTSGSTSSYNPTGSINGAGLFTLMSGANAGILSCTTVLSDVVFAYTNGSYSISQVQPMNGTAVAGLVAGLVAGKRKSFVDEQLHQGLQQTAVTATTPVDFAHSFARAYDQAAMALPAGIMVPRQALNMTRRIETLVTRIPKAPFICVIFLDLLYVVGGIILTVSALVSIKSGHGIGDAQARLGTAAVVAQCFESPALGNDAVDVKALYAERRGMPTSRIALSKRNLGGREYSQIVSDSKL